jgi:hypothetical protein
VKVPSRDQIARRQKLLRRQHRREALIHYGRRGLMVARPPAVNAPKGTRQP